MHIKCKKIDFKHKNVPGVTHAEIICYAVCVKSCTNKDAMLVCCITSIAFPVHHYMYKILIQKTATRLINNYN